MSKKKDDFYTVAEAGKVLNRSVQTIYKWMHSGKLSGAKNPATGKYIISREDVDQLADWA